MVLENYGHAKKVSEDPNKQGSENRWVQEVLKHEGHVSAPPEVTMRVPSWKKLVNDKGEVNATV